MEALTESLAGEIESLSKLISSLPDPVVVDNDHHQLKEDKGPSSDENQQQRVLADEIESLTQIVSNLSASKSTSALTEDSVALPPPPPPPLAIEKWNNNNNNNNSSSATSNSSGRREIFAKFATLGRRRRRKSSSSSSSKFSSLERLRDRVKSKSRDCSNDGGLDSDSSISAQSRRLLSSTSTSSSTSDVTVIHNNNKRSTAISRFKSKTGKSAEDLLKAFPNFYIGRSNNDDEKTAFNHRASVRRSVRPKLPDSNSPGFAHRIRQELMLARSASADERGRAASSGSTLITARTETEGKYLFINRLPFYLQRQPRSMSPNSSSSSSSSSCWGDKVQKTIFFDHLK